LLHRQLNEISGSGKSDVVSLPFYINKHSFLLHVILSSSGKPISASRLFPEALLDICTII